MVEISSLPEEVQGVLKPGEAVQAFAWANIKRRPLVPLVRLGPFLLVVPLINLVRNRIAKDKLRQASAAWRFPLDRRMAVCVTTDRLIIWRASTDPRRIRALLGEVPRARIASAKLPYVGGAAYRTVELKTIDGATIRFRVDNEDAEGFVAALAAQQQPHDQTV